MSEGFVSRSPDYSVSALDKTSGLKGKVGVAWRQPDGSVRVKFNAFVTLPSPLDNVVLACWPETGNVTAIQQQRPKKGDSKTADRLVDGSYDTEAPY